MDRPEDEKPWSRGRAIGLAVAVCTLGTTLLGLILHQITIRISPEYFTVYRPRIIASDDLTLTALAWGLRTSWWVGVLIGLYVGLVAVAGDLPIATRREVLTMTAVIFGGVVLAIVVMFVRGLIKAPTSTAFPVGDNHALTRAQILHITSYLAPIPLAIGSSLWIISRRYKRNLERLRAART